MIFTQNQNELKCYGHIFSGNGPQFVERFERMQRQYSNITIRLHTNGGSVMDGNLIFNSINKSTSKVKIIVDGLAASMGAIILMATDDVEIVDNGYIMIHAPSGGAWGNAVDLRNTAKLLEFIEKDFISKLINRTDRPKSAVEKLMTGDNWFDAKQAKEIGLVSQIIKSTTKPAIKIDDPKNYNELDVYNAFSSLLTEGIQPVNNAIQNTMKQLLIQAFALASVNLESSDTAIVEAISQKLKNEENAKLEALQKITDLEAKIKASNQESVKSVIDAHAKNNPISDEKRKVLEKVGEDSGVDALMTILDSEPKGNTQIPSINSLLTTGKSANVRADWNWDKWQEEDPRGLENLAKTNAEAYNKLFNDKYKK